MIFLNSASSAAALVFYMPGVCTHTNNEGRPESGIYFKIRKKTQYLINSLSLSQIFILMTYMITRAYSKTHRVFRM